MLIRELLRHVEKVAILGAKIQFKDENKSYKSQEYLTCCDVSNNYRKNSLANTRYRDILRFHMAYMKYFVFAMDPYAEVIVPISSSSLTLFITNIISKVLPDQPIVHQTSKTIIEFLQVSKECLSSPIRSNLTIPPSL